MRDSSALPGSGRFWLLAALTLVISPHLLRLPAWLAAGCGAVLVWGVGRELKGWAVPGAWVKLGITLAAVGGVLAGYGSVVGREPGIALLVVMLCLKLLELHTLRDGMLVVFLGYFLAVGNFLFSQSVFMGVYMMAAVLALTGALAALNHPAGTLGRSGDYLKLAGTLLLQSVPLMVLLFVLFPRLEGPLWAMPSDGASGRTGLSESMRIGAITHLADSEEVAFRVRFADKVPAADKLYWRGPVLWHTDGRDWEMRQAGAERAPQYQALGDAVDYTVTVEPHEKKWLFALDLPAQPPPRARATAEYQLLAEHPVMDVRRYEMRSFLAYSTGPLPAWQRYAGLGYPGATNPRTRELGRQWQASGLSGEAVVRAALAYFAEQPFYYTRRPPALEGADPVDRFLFDSRRGFCEHYAASFTLLMRAAGVPSRVVTGYQGGEINPLGNYLVVRQSDAHAWSEVWLEERGWVRVDPTAAVPAHRVEADMDLERFRSTAPGGFAGEGLHWVATGLRRLGQSWDALNHAWNQWVLGFDAQRQRDLIERLGLEGLGRVGLGLLLVAVVGGTVALLTLAALRRPRRREDPVSRAYRRFCDKLARAGLPRAPGEGPLEYARRIGAERPGSAAQVELITGLYTRLRYADGDTSQWLPKLRRHVEEFEIR